MTNNYIRENVLDLTQELIARASITPKDVGCQALIAAKAKSGWF